MYYLLYYGVCGVAVITVRVPKEIKEKLEKYNVNVSETVRKFLSEYVSELEMRDLAERLEILRKRLGDKISPELIADL
ncbi:MAG TPA: hypothetical protein ENF42_01525, partial [Candidatus Bathyarchaeota archaeon]|nr:hypothetical protein [Candidatus Bathyarchaeota archaeon]